MKVVIASDIHGAADYCEKLMQVIEEEQPKYVLLLGDLLYHGPRNDLPADYAPKRVIEMLNSISDKVIAVRGNCEAEVDQMVLDFPCMADYNILFDKDPKTGKQFTIFFTHGHVFGPGIHNSVDKSQHAECGPPRGHRVQPRFCRHSKGRHSQLRNLRGRRV